MSRWFELVELTGDDAPWADWECAICDDNFVHSAGEHCYIMAGDVYVCVECANKHGIESTKDPATTSINNALGEMTDQRTILERALMTVLLAHFDGNERTAETEFTVLIEQGKRGLKAERANDGTI